jgi:hypothetical protein
MQQKRTSSRTTVSRAVYDPTIREVIAEGDLAKMKRVYTQAKQLLEQQGDLKSAVERLEKAIKARERT